MRSLHLPKAMALVLVAASQSACSRSPRGAAPAPEKAPPAASVPFAARTSASAPPPGKDAVDELVRGEMHWPLVGPSDLLDNICEASLCVVTWRKTTSRGPILEVAIYAPRELNPLGRGPSGLRREFLALRTARGWFAQQRSPYPEPNLSSIPYDRVHELDDGVLLDIHEQLPPRSIDEHSPPRIEPGPERETTVHCNADAAHVPACTSRIPARSDADAGGRGARD